jgi:hypothetical protein
VLDLASWQQGPFATMRKPMGIAEQKARVSKKWEYGTLDEVEGPLNSRTLSEATGAPQPQ